VSWFTHRLTGGVDDSQLERVSFTPSGREWIRTARVNVLGVSGRIGNRSIWEIDTRTRTADYSATVRLPVTSQLTVGHVRRTPVLRGDPNPVLLEGNTFSVSTLETISGANLREAQEDFVENITVGTFIQNEFNWEGRIFITGSCALG
jgi:hypothetical protein